MKKRTRSEQKKRAGIRIDNLANTEGKQREENTLEQKRGIPTDTNRQKADTGVQIKGKQDQLMIKRRRRRKTNK